MSGPVLNASRGRSFTSAGSEHWGTPQEVYRALDEEFDFDLDPCPGEAVLSKYMTHLYAPEYLTTRDWQTGDPARPTFSCAFVNPPYGRTITQWIARTIRQVRRARDYRIHLQEHAADWRPDAVQMHSGEWVFAPISRAVMLLPARTDTAWWHDLILPNAEEIRFVRGRLGYTGVPSKPERDRQKQRSRAPFPSVVVVL